MRKSNLSLTAVAAVIAAICSSAQAGTVYQLQQPIPKLVVTTPLATVTTPSTSSTTTTAPAPAPTKHVELSSNKVEFGNVDVSSSKTMSVMLSNVGTGSVSVTSPSITGSMFTVDSNCPQTLASMASCAANITFSPSAIGAATGTLSFPTDAVEDTLSVALSGTGLAGSPSLKPDTTADFGGVLTGSMTSRTFVLKNEGNKAISGLYPVVNGTGISIVTSGCGTVGQPATLEPGASCMVVVQFAPTVRATLTGASLAVAGLTQALTGQGIAPVGALSPAANTNFGTVNIGSPVSRTFTYTNSGDADATGVKAALAGSDLTMTANTCGTQATPVTVAKNGGTCTVTVQYAPTAPGSLSGASLSINGAHTGAAASLALSGSAQEAPPLASHYILLLHAEGTNGATNVSALVDSSPTPLQPNYMGPVVSIDTTTSKFGSGSLKINNFWNTPSWGSGWVQFPHQTGGVRRYSMGTGDFTIDSFVKSSSHGCYGANYFAFETWDANTNVIYPSWAVDTTQSGQLQFTVYKDDGTPAYRLTSSTTLPTNTWNHIGVSRKAGTVRLFINGSQVASGTFTGGMEQTRFYGDVPFVIGRPVTGGSGCFSGVHNFDEVRVLKGYGVSTLPVPTAPYAP